MKRWPFFLLFSFFACSPSSHHETNYPEDVGDIAFDSKTDDPSFKTCHERVYQYYNFGKGFEYKGEKPALEEHFKKLKQTEYKGDDGYITIRFIVNCEGKTGRFRIQEMSTDYTERSFNKELVTRCLELTKQLDGWIIKEHNSQQMDYYQYLTFKIEEGRLTEILP